MASALLARLPPAVSSLALPVATTAAAAVMTLFYVRAHRNEKRVAAAVKALTASWADLRNTVEVLRHTDEVLVLSPVSPGQRVRVLRFEEVSNSSLWENAFTDYCGREGVVFKIDTDDGDVDVKMDDGVVITVDVKFVRPLSQHQTLLKTQIDEMAERLAKLQLAVPSARTELFSLDKDLSSSS